MKADFANRDERLWPGEFVNVRVTLRVRRNVPTVPAQTIQNGADGSFVYVIKPDDTVERRAVTVAAIQDGIAVVDGQYRLTNGVRVGIVPATPQSVTG